MSKLSPVRLSSHMHSLEEEQDNNLLYSTEGSAYVEGNGPGDSPKQIFEDNLVIWKIYLYLEVNTLDTNIFLVTSNGFILGFWVKAFAICYICPINCLNAYSIPNGLFLTSCSCLFWKYLYTNGQVQKRVYWIVSFFRYARYIHWDRPYAGL